MVAKNEEEGLASHNESQPGAVSGDESIKVDRRFVDGAVVPKGKKSLVDVDKINELEADALQGVTTATEQDPAPKSDRDNRDVVVTVTLGTPTEITKN